MTPPPVLLVSCYELGHQPLALAWPAAFLARSGHRVATLDLSVEPFDDERVRAARLVAVSVPMHTALRLGLRALARIRAASPSVHVCFYGLYAAMNAAALLARGVDSVLGGECEQALVRLADALGAEAAGGSAPRPPAATARERLDFPVPRRDGLPELARYGGLVEGEATRLAGYVEASRGCLHRCRHCPIVPVYDGRFVAVPAAVVLADAAQQVAAGATHLTFGDPDFLNGPTHALRVARALHAAHPGLSFDVTIKVEHLLRHAALLAELRALGCRFVVSAFESLSDGVLERLDKGHTRADLDRALDVLDRAGLAPRPTFVPFTPWSGLGDYLELLAWIEAHDLVEHVDPIQLAIRLLVPPGSRLLELPPGEGWPGELDEEAFTHRWRHRDPAVDMLQARVAARVEEAARGREPAARTFAAVRALALAAAGRAGEPLPALPLRGPRRDRPPRLAESWFC